MHSERIILGIDPGTQVMGYGLIAVKGNKIELITLGVFKFSSKEEHSLRLKKIFESVLELIDKNHPDELAIEAPFFGKNVQSMLKLGRAQGVAMAAALYRDIPIFEFSPRKIKQSITGKGGASKEQVAAMLGNLTSMPTEKIPLDASDAVAAAVCQYLQNTNAGVEKKFTGWKSFIDQNPKKVIDRQKAVVNKIRE